MASLTPSSSTLFPSQSPLTTQAVKENSFSGPKKAGIIAGAVVGGLLIICLIVAIIVPLQRKRGRNKKQRPVYGAKSEVMASTSASDGMSPLLVTPHAWHLRPNDVEDDHGAAEHGSGAGAEVTDNSRGTSDSTLLMPLVRESEQRTSYPSNTYLSPPTKDNIRSMSLNSSPVRRMLTINSVASHESTYSQASASTRMHHDLERYTSPPPPVPALPAQLQLPPIPQTEPIGELLKARAAAAGASSWNANESTEDAAFSPTSIYSPTSPSAPTSTNFNLYRQLSRGPSTRTRTPDQLLQGTPTRPPRGTPARSRTILPKPPMEPLVEFDGSSLWSLSPSGTGKERWSSAADPGGSHPRAMGFDRDNKDASADQKPDSLPPTPSQLASTQGTGFGRGLSILTTAFRKSLSASSDATHGSGSSHPSQHTDNTSALHHYPSVASMGASVTSGTGSGTGSFYTAMSDTGNDSQYTGNRNSGVGMLAPSVMRKKKGSQTSLSTFPSIPSLPSTSRLPRSNPLVPPVPPLPPISKPTAPHPRTLDTISNLNAGPGSKSSPTPRVKAHLRTPAAHRVRAEPAITRAGRSSHGVIDVTED